MLNMESFDHNSKECIDNEVNTFNLIDNDETFKPNKKVKKNPENLIETKEEIKYSEESSSKDILSNEGMLNMEFFDHTSKECIDNEVKAFNLIINDDTFKPNKKVKKNPSENLIKNKEEINYSEESSSKDLLSNEDSEYPWLSPDPTIFIKWMQDRKLIKTEMFCFSCHKKMNWTRYTKTTDGFAWKCQIKTCKKFKSTLSVRKGSLFENAHLSLKKLIHILYLWSNNESELHTTIQTKVSVTTLGVLYGLFREMCKRYLQCNPILLGGPEKIIQIVDSCFLSKPKRRRNKEHKQPINVFCLVDTSSEPVLGYMEIVETREAKFLLPIIQRAVRPGTIIQTNQWRTYQNELEISNSIELTNSIIFTEPDARLYSKVTMAYWEKQKDYIRKMKGCKREFLPSYLQEFMWRDQFGVNAFDSICNLIAKEFPL